MGLIKARIAEIQADLFAEDVDMPAEAISWSEEQLVAYIEQGGAEPMSVPARTVPPVPMGRPPRVACLHGTAGNEKIFRMQLAKLIASLRGEVLFDVFEGSRVIEPGNPHGDSMRKYFGQNEVLKEYAPAGSDADGLRIYEPQATADAIVDLEVRISGAGGCDVMLGFSQGANFISMLAARLASGIGPLSPVRCIILLAPSRPGWVAQPAWRALFANPIGLPCLVVGGASDEAAGTGPTEVAALFRDCRFIEHTEGHRPLPAARQGAEEVMQAIRTFLRELCLE
jgi:predicted esterase